jgi:hypothetical protein
MTKVIVADFSAGESIYEKLEIELADVPIGILGECMRQKQNIRQTHTTQSEIILMKQRGIE